MLNGCLSYLLELYNFIQFWANIQARYGLRLKIKE